MRLIYASVLLLLVASVVLSGCEKIRFAGQAKAMRALSDASQQDTTVTDVTASRDPSGREARLLSAFFGLDGGLPPISNRGICKGAGGKDGMPVVFSHEVDVRTVQAGDFRVVSDTGAVGSIICVTPAPANDPGELRTILVVGQYGSADDQPSTVEIVGNLLSKDGLLNFRGAQASVTRLEEGPTMVWSEIVPETQWELGKPATPLPFGGGDRCPPGSRQVVRVTWAGGVTKPGGAEIDDEERAAYRVLTTLGDGALLELTPFAIADRGDGDNNHLLCLDSAGAPLEVVFPAGLLTDPREDLNPATRVTVTSN